MNHRDYIRRIIEDYSKVSGAQICDSIWKRLRQYYIPNCDIKIKLITDTENRIIYDFYISIDDFTIESKYLSYKRLKKIETLLNGVQGLHKV